ncbi:MAG: hypothetical protein WCN86_02495 [bacterium]
MGIKSIIPSQVLNSNGDPTIKVTMVAENGVAAYFTVPSGASLGSKEVAQKTDGTDSYNGKSVNGSIKLIAGVVAPKFIGYPIGHQSDFDSLLIALDGSENKQNLGGNTILAMSGAYFKLSAKLSEKPLWQYIAEDRKTSPAFPRIFANLVGGGKHAPGLDIQEFMIVPKSNKPIEAIEQIVQTFHTLTTIMVSLYGPGAQLAGTEGAIAPIGASTEVVLEALSNLNAKNGKTFEIALDVAANSFFDGKSYNFEGQSIHASDLLAVYQGWDSKFDLYSIEDPFAEADIEGTELLKTMPKDKKPFKVIADDYTVTNASLIAEFSKDKLFDGVIIKPDQVGSISEMFTAIDAAKQAGLDIIVSHRSGESNDDFIVDLAYGIGAAGIKIGAPNHGERIAKYNRLLEIQYSLNSSQEQLDSTLDLDQKPTATPLESSAGKVAAMAVPTPVEKISVAPSAVSDDTISPKISASEPVIVASTPVQPSESLASPAQPSEVSEIGAAPLATEATPPEPIQPTTPIITHVVTVPPETPMPSLPKEQEVPSGSSFKNATIALTPIARAAQENPSTAVPSVGGL